MFLADYNFCWRLRLPDKGRNRMLPAMMAGVVNTLMSFEDLFDAVTGGATRWRRENITKEVLLQCLFVLQFNIGWGAWELPVVGDMLAAR